MKTHLVDSRVAILEGSQQEALCGERIQRAKLVPVSEGDYLPGDRMTSVPRGVCSQCLKAKVMRYLVQDFTEAEG